MIGPGNAADAVRFAVADPPVWTRAPLFVGPPAPTSAAVPAVATRSSDGNSAAAVVRDVSAIVPFSAGLFVAPAGHGDAR